MGQASKKYLARVIRDVSNAKLDYHIPLRAAREAYGEGKLRWDELLLAYLDDNGFYSEYVQRTMGPIAAVTPSTTTPDYVRIPRATLSSAITALKADGDRHGVGTFLEKALESAS